MHDTVSRWNESYNRGENNILEPYEELVKFLNRFIVSRSADTAPPSIKENFATKDIATTSIVDLGCGIGAQSEYLAKMGFECHGFDISTVAVKAATDRTQSMKNAPIFNTCTTEKINLPESFNIAIACASLDSMPLSDASQYMKHLRNAASSSALFFGTFIGRAHNDAADEEIVTDAHEFGTVQSYFDPDRIEVLLSAGDVELLRLDRTSNVNIIPGITGRASDRFVVVGRFPL